jgi:hypothetical protein
VRYLGVVAFVSSRRAVAIPTVVKSFDHTNPPRPAVLRWVAIPLRLPASDRAGKRCEPVNGKLSLGLGDESETPKSRSKRKGARKRKGIPSRC